MPGNRSSSGAFCSIVVTTTTGNSDSIASLLEATLGDGAEAYCAANGSVYRMKATSTQATLLPIFIKPNSGIGCWVKQNAESNYTFEASGTSAFRGAAVGSPGVTNTWTALSSNPNFYVKTSPAPTSVWTLDTTTGIITYAGPSGESFIISGNLSIAKGLVTPTPLVYELDMTVNGSQIGSTTSFPSASAGSIVGAAGIYGGFVQTLILTLNNGDTVQHCFRRVTATASLVAETFSNYEVLIRLA